MHPDLPRYQVALRCTSPGSSTRLDLQILMTSYATDRVDRGGDGRTPVGIVLQPVLNQAVGQGEIRLRSSDASVQPTIDLDLLAETSDRERLREGLRLAIRLGQHPAFADIVGERIEIGRAHV